MLAKMSFKRPKITAKGNKIQSARSFAKNNTRRQKSARMLSEAPKETMRRKILNKSPTARKPVRIALAKREKGRKNIFLKRIFAQQSLPSKDRKSLIPEEYPSQANSKNERSFIYYHEYYKTKFSLLSIYNKKLNTHIYAKTKHETLSKRSALRIIPRKL